MTCMLTSDFHANQIVFVWSCVKRLGTNGFKFSAKGNLPVILSSMVSSQFRFILFICKELSSSQREFPNRMNDGITTCLLVFISTN